MAEFSWHMLYNSDVTTYLGHIEKTHPHNLSVLRSYLSLKRPLEILGAYPVNTIYDCTFEQFQFATSLLLQNQKHNLPVEKHPADFVIARDCYGGYVAILIDLPANTGTLSTTQLQTIFCLPLLGRFCIQLLQQNKWQEMALTQPCKSIRVIAGVENGQASAQEQHADIKVFQSSSKIDPS